jgi:hypothetical protein
MPRGIKGSGKSRKPATEPGPPRRRGRKPKGPPPEGVQPGELLDEESRVAEELPAAEPAPDEAPASPAPDLPAQPSELAAAEAELVRKYPHVRIRPGSLRLGAAEGWGNKRIVTIVCGACEVNERDVATSDLFHVSMCQQCSKTAKKAARKAKKEGRP